MSKEQTKTIEVAGKYILIVKVDKGVEVGSLAIHNNKEYRDKYPQDNDHIVECTVGNQSSIDEHWRQIVGYFALSNGGALKNTPYFTPSQLLQENTTLKAQVSCYKLAAEGFEQENKEREAEVTIYKASCAAKEEQIASLQANHRALVEGNKELKERVEKYKKALELIQTHQPQESDAWKTAHLALIKEQD